MDIYEQHDKAFSRVSAWIVLKDGERVATVAIKYPADGAGRLWAYCHLIGLPMERGYSGGYGYDKRSPAVASAFAKAHRRDSDSRPVEAMDDTLANAAAINAALAGDSGEYWDRRLENAGFTVLQAV
jgi:hypothetical protein